VKSKKSMKESDFPKGKYNNNNSLNECFKSNKEKMINFVSPIAEAWEKQNNEN